MDMVSKVQGLLINDWTVGGALVLVGAVHFVGGGLSDMMEKTLFGQSWLTVGRVLSLIPLSIGVAVLSKKLIGKEIDPLGVTEEV
jgi:hypothetical protein|tara:strand:- start:1178 stop:1432 length:255 start_codon:yes stop_codon:yes gene_type:complete